MWISQRVCETGQRLLSLGARRGERGSERHMNTWQHEALGGSQDPPERDFISLPCLRGPPTTAAASHPSPALCPPTVRFATSQVCSLQVHAVGCDIIQYAQYLQAYLGTAASMRQNASEDLKFVLEGNRTTKCTLRWDGFVSRYCCEPV